MPVPNSFCWYASPSPGYMNDLNAFIHNNLVDKLPGFNHALEMSKHLTLCLAAQKPYTNVPAFAIREMTVLYANRYAGFKKSIFLLPACIFISQSNYVCIEYFAVDLLDQGDILSLHQDLARLAIENDLSFQKKFSLSNYKPHLTIGKVDDAIQAKQYMNANYGNLFKALSDVRLLNIFNINLVHTTQDLKQVTLIENQPLARRDYGVTKVTRMTEEDKSWVVCNDNASAKKCLLFLSQFGKTTSDAPESECDQTTNSFKIDNEQLKLVSGLVNKVIY